MGSKSIYPAECWKAQEFDIYTFYFEEEIWIEFGTGG